MKQTKGKTGNRRVFMAGLGIAGAACIVSCTSKSGQSTAIAQISRADTLNALRPPKRKRPLIAILTDNHGSETTDLIVPWSVLKRSDVADVVIVSTVTGAVQLMPALKIQPDMSIAQFDALHPKGSDYVIVPAFHNPKNPVAAKWLQQQKTGRATIAGICSGALVLAHAGLLADRQATTHWYDRKKLTRISPTTTLALNTRYIADRGIATTTGVSASLPFALTLLEAIAGKKRAERQATKLGLSDFGQSHNSADFRLRAKNVLNLATNYISSHDNFGQQIDHTTDELALAFIADAWSRTYRTSVSTYAATDSAVVETQNGLKLLPDTDAKTGANLMQLPRFNGKPADALPFTLKQISQRYDTQTADFVALQLEYKWRG